MKYLALCPYCCVAITFFSCSDSKPALVKRKLFNGNLPHPTSVTKKKITGMEISRGEFVKCKKLGKIHFTFHAVLLYLTKLQASQKHVLHTFIRPNFNLCEIGLESRKNPKNKSILYLTMLSAF